MTVPISKASLTLTMDNLRSLTVGATYVAKQGQATAKVSSSGDTITITATCDSLQYLVWKYEKELKQYRDKQTLEVVKKETKAFSLDKYHLTAIAVILILILIIIVKLKK